MTEKIGNPVSKAIVNESISNQIALYFPEIVFCKGLGGNGYAIGAKLPRDYYKKWIAYINNKEGFRKFVKQEIENIFSSHVFEGQSYLKIIWDSRGTTFETDGVNGCMAYVSDGESYTCHNIDTFEQAMVLFMALSMYLPRLYFALDTFESDNIDLENFSPSQERIVQTIKLNRVKGCQMTSEQCIHWKTWICDLCTRNPKAYFILRQEDLDRIGDKWEPEGGLDGRELCHVCGTNISYEKCTHCNSD